MKYCRLNNANSWQYEDNQLTLPIKDSKCVNAIYLTEYAVMGMFYSTRQLREMYACLGHEYGLKHLSDSETVLLMNAFDGHLMTVVQNEAKGAGESEEGEYAHRLFNSTRHEFLISKVDIEYRLLAEFDLDPPSCASLPRFAFPKPSFSASPKN